MTGVASGNLTGIRRFWRDYWQALLAGIGLIVVATFKAGWMGLVFAVGACIFLTSFMVSMHRVLGSIRRRRRELQALAAQRRWTFDRIIEPVPFQSIAPFTQLLMGGRQRMENILTGSLNSGADRAEFIAGDLAGIDVLQTRKGTHERVHVFSFVLCDLPRSVASPLFIRPQLASDDLIQIFSRLMVASNDIDFESAEFNRSFIVRCADKRLAYEVVSPRAMHLLLESRPPALAIDGRRLCITDCARCWTACDFDRYLAFLEEFLGLWPAPQNRPLS